jgi:hypothetical protein
MSKSTHAELTRSRIDQLRQQLTDENRNEQRVLEETEATSRILKDSSKEQIAEDLTRIEAAQAASAKNLQKLTTELQNAVREALQNNSVPESTIADIQKIIEELEKIANPSMKEAAQNIQSAKQDSSKATEALEKAPEAQRKAIDAMSKASPAINAGNAALRTRNFHTRLLSAAQLETALCAELSSLPASGVGATLGSLSDYEREVLKKHTVKQKDLAQSIGTLAYELEAFLEQAPNSAYQTVHDEITAKDAVAAIIDIAENVRINLRYRASERAEGWAKQFTVWADIVRGVKGDSKKKDEADSSDSSDSEDPISRGARRFVESLTAQRYRDSAVVEMCTDDAAENENVEEEADVGQPATGTGIHDASDSSAHSDVLANATVLHPVTNTFKIGHPFYRCCD